MLLFIKAHQLFLRITIFIIAVAVTSMIGWVSSSYAAQGVYRTINFQGKVVNKTAGTNVANGNYDFTFRLYDAATNGTLLWTENWTAAGGGQLAVTDGIFRVTLGSHTTFASANVDFNSDSLYLDITFNGETMGSRVRFTAVPYALNAEKVSGLTVTNNGGNTLNIAANKTFAVNNSLTFSGTDSTSFSFPSTSGGTVLTSTAPTQGITSTQTSGTLFALTDSTALTAAIKGLSVTLSGGNAFDQTGLEFNLSNASGTNVNDIVGSGGTWKISRTGALTVSSCTGCGIIGSPTNYWQLNDGALSPFSITADVNLGATATSSAKISLAGSLTRGLAAAIINQTESQDIFTASASGTTRFVITNDGSIGIGTRTPTSLLHLTRSTVTSGPLALFDATQTSVNTSDTSDMGLQINHSLSASSASNELVQRGVMVNMTNSLTGGGAISNMRGLTIKANTSASTVTTALDNIYIENGTTSGTVQDSRGLMINGLQGTSRAGIAINSLTGTNNTYVVLGSGNIPTGNFGIHNSSTFNNYFAGNLGLGTATPIAKLQVDGVPSEGGNALVILNETANQNILSASASGTTVLNLTRTGNVEADGVFSFGDSTPDGNAYNTIGTGDATNPSITNSSDLYVTNDLETGGSLIVAGAIELTGAAALNDDVTIGNTLSLTSYPNCASLGTSSSILTCNNTPNTNYWQLNAGALTPFSITADINLGATATASAKISLAGSLTRGKAVAIFNQTEDQDILTASASGVTKFTLDKNGNIFVGDGSLSAPAFSFLSETGLGFYRSATNTLSLAANGTQVLSASDVQIASNVPHQFNAAGDVVIAYDLVFSNQTASYIKSNAGLYLEAGEVFESNTLTMKTYNSGNVVFDTSTSAGVQIGTSEQIGKLQVSGTKTGKALTVLDELGDQSVLTASASGSTIFTLERDGDVHADGAFNFGDTTPDATAYNKLGTGTKGGANVADGNDLFISDSLELDGTLYLGTDALTDITGNGLTISSNALTLQTPSAADALSSTTSNGSGLEVLSGGVTLLQGCADGQILKWTESSDTWGCANDAGAGAESQQASYYNPLQAVINILSSQTEIGEITITPNATTADVYIVGEAYLLSSNNTDQTLVLAIEDNNNCTGNTVASASHTITANAGVRIGTRGVTAVVSDAGTSALTYTLCASTATGDTDIESVAFKAYVVDNGADLAEIYTTHDNTMESGDVVMLDATLKTGVKKTSGAYNKDVFGVVSTIPGYVIGGVEDEGAKAVPIALSGRVPVKVSLENGSIEPGDPLTSSSTPGVAMKATKQGYIIGRSMESYTSDDSSAIGSVMAFMHVGWFAPENNSIAALETEVASLSAMLRSFSASSSALPLWDPVWLDIAPQQQVLSATTSSLLAIDLTSQDATVSGKLRVQGSTLFEDVVTVIDTLITNNFIVNGIADFFDKVTFREDVEFRGQLTVSDDTSGIAVIKKGADHVEITFKRPYEQIPLVTTSISLDSMVDEQASADTQKLQEAAQTKLENAILSGDIHYVVTRKTKKGFIIKLNKKAPDTIQFTWTTLAVRDVPMTQSSFTTRQSTLTPTMGLEAEKSVAGAKTSAIMTVTPILNAQAEKKITIQESELGYLRVREEPRSSSKEVDQVLPGQSFGVLESDNGWFNIEYQKGKTGWVSSLYVKVTY